MGTNTNGICGGPFWRCGDCGVHYDFDQLTHHVVRHETEAGSLEVNALESRLVVTGDDLPGTEGYEIFRFICPNCGYKDQYPEADLVGDYDE